MKTTPTIPDSASTGKLMIVLLLVLWFSGSFYSKEWPEIPPNPTDERKVEDFLEIYEELIHLTLDETRVARVKNLNLSRDVASFELQEGYLYLCKPVKGRVIAALFTGKGVFHFSPPTRIEKEHLYRFYKKDTLHEPFKMLFLIFADSTLRELESKIEFAPAEINRGEQEKIDYALKYLSNPKVKFFDYGIMKTFLEGSNNGLFYAHFSKSKIKPLFFYINPFSNEEVRFMRRLKGPSYIYAPEIINQFHTQQEYVDSSFINEPEKNDLYIRQYQIDCTLEGSRLNFSAQTIIEFTPLIDSLKWLAFALYDELEMDSLVWGDGTPAMYIKEKGNPVLWVKGDTPFLKDSLYVLKMNYHGKLIERKKDWFYIQSSKGWYPRHGEYQKAMFDITFHYPDDFDLVSIGERVSQDTSDNIITSHWRTSSPIRNASFNVGFFDEYRIEKSNLPPVTVLIAETGHQEFARALSRIGVGSGKNMEKEVGGDIYRSIELFQEVFGPAPVDHFYITDIPYMHGEAFPGLVHLSWITFQRTAAGGMDEVFRAHEVAHQWWGIGVDIKSYHDQWISEGFAEYSGWWYYQSRLQEEKKEKDYYDMLKDWRKKITGNRKYFLGKGQAAAPIWLGYRTHSSDTKGDYNLIIYKKGAWILHMLRSLLTNVDTGDDSQFEQLMKGFYREFVGKNASTEDFMEYIEEKIGTNMQWFFDQWVYGSQIPTYHAAHQIVTTPSGEYQVNCRIRQSGVDETFRMPLLIAVTFKNETSPKVFRVWVEGKESHHTLGTFPEKPEKVIFNYHESVLCELKTEKW